jgi:hypothetical protein
MIKFSFDLRKDGVYTSSTLGHATPLELKTIAMEGDVSKSAIRGQGRFQRLIE